MNTDSGQQPGSDAAPAPQSNLARDRILIVEDNQNIAAAMAKVLSQGGYRPVVCHTGNNALDVVGSMNGSRSALVAALVDIHLPDLHGLVLSSKLRELLGPAVPIIVISGDTSMANLNALSHVGATYFLSKPLNPAALLARLKQYLPPSSERR